VSSVFVDYKAFKKNCPISDLDDAICNMPEETIPCLSLAAIRILEHISEQVEQQSVNELQSCQYSHAFLEALRSIPPVSPGARPWIRFYNLEQSTPLKELKAAFVGKLVSVTGTVIRVSNIRQQVLAIPFICCRCGNEIMKHLPDYKYCVPHRCISETCKSKTFKPVRNKALTVDWQKIRIQVGKHSFLFIVILFPKGSGSGNYLQRSWTDAQNDRYRADWRSD
jgi:DNA helicase MCM8